MSSFLVSNLCINRAVQGIVSELSRTAYGWPREFQEIATQYRDEKCMIDCKKLGDAFFKLNIYALNVRYEGKEIHCPSFTYVPLKENKLAFFKAIECLIYQCSEGDTTELPLFRLLEYARDKIARTICHDLPNYDRIEWG